MKRYDLFISGSSLGFNSYGASAYILQRCKTGTISEAAKSFRRTSAPRAELRAVLLGLRSLKTPSVITLHARSNYVLQGLTHALRWSRTGWMTIRGQEIKHRDLWEKIIPLLDFHQVSGVLHPRGDGVPKMERCHRLSNQEARQRAMQDMYGVQIR